MAEETYGFEQARVRLEEIASQVKRKDTSLEKSLDLLEEGVRLANLCTEQIDHTQWKSAVREAAEADPASAGATDDPAAQDSDGVGDTEAAEGEECEETPAGAEADGDVPVEDSYGADADPPAEDPDVEA